MTDRELIDQSGVGGDDGPHPLSEAPEALAYLRFIRQETPDLLAVSLVEVLTVCPELLGVVLPLYGPFISALEREILAYVLPEAAVYFNDCRRVSITHQLPVFGLRPLQADQSNKRSHD